MSITIFMIVLGAIGASLNTAILLGSILKDRKSSKFNLDSRTEKLKLTLISQNEKGEEKILKEETINKSDAEKILRTM